jgi:DegV family protein with EDD domain
MPSSTFNSNPTISPIEFYVDAACDLPHALIADGMLKVLPVAVEVGGAHFDDVRDPAATLRFHRDVLSQANAATAGRSTPPTSPQIAQFLQTQFANANQVIGLHVTSTRSTIFVNARQAANKVRMLTYADRVRSGNGQQLMLDCVDSLGLFAGYGVQAIEMLELARAGATYDALLARLALNAQHAHTYAAPQALEFVVERARSKGDQSVGDFAAMAGKLLNIIPIVHGHRGETAPVGRQFGKDAARRWLFGLAERQITERKLTSRHVVLSFSGDVNEVHAMPGFAALQKTAINANVELHTAQMSMTNAINIGPNALTVGFIGSAPA